MWPLVPSTLAGEGSSVLRRILMGRGVLFARKLFSKQTPLPFEFARRPLSPPPNTSRACPTCAFKGATRASPGRVGEGAIVGSAVRGDTSHCDIHSSLVKQHTSFPRRKCARVVKLSPHPRGGRSADRRTDAALRTRWACIDAADQALARRLASHNAGRSPRGAPPWRFLGSGSALPSAALPPQRVQRAPRGTGLIAWRADSRASRTLRLRAAAAGRHTLLRLQDRLRRRPSMSKAELVPILYSFRSQ
jgi:hypothetical protein